MKHATWIVYLMVLFFFSANVQAEFKQFDCLNVYGIMAFYLLYDYHLQAVASDLLIPDHSFS